MTTPLYQKATAVWLIDNTSLSFEQIAVFCNMHVLEVQGIADGEVTSSVIGKSPIESNQLTRDEITRCENDHSKSLVLSAEMKKYIDKERKKKKSRYTPVARRQDKPNAIAWLVKNCPHASEGQIVKLIGTTKTTIQSIRDKSHWNYSNLVPRDPVLLGLCMQRDLDHLINATQKKEEK